MKRLNLHSASCSCTSCVYRSRSKQSSIQQLIADGSKIDQLYYGKYLPLRERKLLEKLIRTRAVYDDVRNQLISSESSDRTRSEHKIKRREDDSTEKSSAVLKMVDLVDRGHTGTANTSKLSSCCSCCSCSSLRKIKKQMEKHPRVHRHNVPYEAISRYTIEAEKKGRRRRRRLSTKISSKIRAVHFKMKSIRSEPCTCTLSLSSVLTRPSKDFIKKVREKELASKEAEAQKAVKVERKSLKKKLCSCSCKIAKLPIKSIRKFKNKQPSMTTGSDTEMINQTAFKIKKDSVTLFKEKLLRKRAAKDWECESGICIADECIPEECLKKKTRGVGARRRRRTYSRNSGSGRRRSRTSISTRPERVKVTGSRVQAKLKSSKKSQSSMTKFSKPKSLTKISSTTGELQSKRIKSTKQPRGILKDTSVQERTYKSYPPKRTESFVHRDKKQVLPEPKLKSDICECKASSSLTTILKRRTMQSVSKSEIKLKPPSPKPQPEFEKYEMTKKEQTSITSIPKVSRAIKPKPKPKLVMKEATIEEKPIKEKTKPQLVLKEMALDEKAMKKSYDKHKEQVTSKSKLGHALCECKPSTKSVSSQTTISKSKVLSTERVVQQKGVHKTDRPRQHTKESLYTREKKKSKLGHALCECKPSTKSVSSQTTISKSKVLSTERVVQQKGVHKTDRPRQHTKESLYTREKKPVKYPQISSSKSSFSMTSLSKSRLQIKEAMRSPKRLKQEKDIISIRHKPRRKKHTNNETSHHASKEPETGKKAVKKSLSKFEIEFSKKLNPACQCELIEHAQAKRAKRMKPIRSRLHHRKYQHSKKQVTGELSKSSQDSKISYLRKSASQIFKPHRGSVLPFPRECEPLMCIPYECDPQNCARILLSRSKSRRRSARSSTDRSRLKSVGSTTFSQKNNSKSKYIQSKSTETFTRKPKSVLNNPPPQNIERNIRAENSRPQRQAVRISSNFSFDIEFYRNKSPGLKADGAQDFLTEPQKKTKHTDYRRKYKDRGHGKRDSQSRQNTSSLSRSSQSFKNIQVGHRLKRCFCTLTLLQKKKPKVTHVVSRKTMASFPIKELDNIARKKQTQTTSSRIKYVLTPVTSARGSLLPYECECNPYDYAERIKERNRKETRRVSKDTNTMVVKRKSISTFASQLSTKSFSKGIQHIENKPRKPKSRYSYSSKEESKVSSGKTHRQAVRIGSSFTFDIEFSKRKNNQLDLYEQEPKVMKKEKKHLQHKGIKVYKPRIHHESSGTNKLIKTKQTHTEPFLRKCFCTLKLLKKGKKKEKAAPLRNNAYVMHMQNKTITANRADIHYNYERSKIQPFEYMCIPDERNPYTCQKLLQLREINLQKKYSNMADLATVSTLSNMTQTINSSKTQYTVLNKKDSNKMNIKSCQSKQKAWRIGSTASFNIELLKEKSPQKSKSREKDKILKHDHKKIRLETIGSQEFEQTHHIAGDIEQKPKKNGNSLGAALKRCFCTFKFPSNNNNAKEQNKSNLIHRHTKTLSKPSNQFEITKKISQLPNPHISKPPYDLKSDELVSNFKELKRPELKRSYDRYVNTDRHKKSVMSAAASSFSGISKSKSTQSRLLQRSSTSEKKMRVPQKDTKPKCFLSPSRQAVRISSNFRLNSEFSNNRFVPSTHNIKNNIRGDKHNSESKTSTVNKIKGTNDKQAVTRYGFSKSEKLRKEDRASNVGYLLKRCFCTRGVQKKYTTPKTQILKSDNQNNLPHTNQLVQLLQSNESRNNCNAQSLTKLNCSDLNKYRYGGVPLELKLPKDPLKEYIFGHQNVTKNIHLQNSTSFEKRLKSGINLNFNQYQVGYLINTQKLSPFYQSFYALNLNVSKLKNIPKNTHVLEDNECEPGFCIPYECDPVECLKRINSRFQTSKLSETDGQKSKSVALKNKMVRAHRKSRFGKHQGTPTMFGSDLSINIGVYKDTKPQLRNKQTVESCLYPIVKKTKQSSRHALRMGSDVRVAMSLYKEKKQRSDGVTSTSRQRRCRTIASQCTQRELRHSESQKNYQGKSKATGISNFFTRCFCTSKLIKESQSKPGKNRDKKINKPEKIKKGSKPDKAKNTPENKKTKPTKPKKNKKNAVSEKSQTCHQKNKKICKEYKCEGTSVNKPCRHSIDAYYQKFKSTASLMSKSRKITKSRSFQPKGKGKDWSSCTSYCVQKKRSVQKKHRDNSLRQSRNVTFGSNIHFDMEFYKDRSQGKGDQVRSGPKTESCKSKKPKTIRCKCHKSARDQEYNEGLLHPDHCETNTCVPIECSPIECKKRINIRRLRSKNTNVSKYINAPSAKSVATDTSITKSKGHPCSCHPHDCGERLTELGMIQPDFSKTSEKTDKYSSSSTQNHEDKPILTNKQNRSVLKCFCVYTQRTSKQPNIIQTHERYACPCRKSNLNNFIEKCVCSLKHLKGSKQLTPKPSKEQIATVKNTYKLKATDTLKPGIKFEMKTKTQQAAIPGREMQTIMPYSKRKFKKHESQTKLEHEASNTHKEGINSNDSNLKQVVMFCPVCKNVSHAQSSKQLEGVGDGNNGQELCPVCHPKPARKYNKKAKKSILCPCMGDGNQVGRNEQALETTTRNKQERKEKQTRSKKVTLQDEEQCPKSVCPCCKRVSSLETCKNIKESMKRKLFSMCSFFKGNKSKEKPKKNIDSDPLFEMLVNKNNMNILNREEVLKNLGSNGKESKAMQKARKAIQRGEVSSPLIEMIIDKNSANIVNKDDIINQINKQHRGEKAKKSAAKNLQPPETAQRTDSHPNGKRSSKSHGSKCKCCVCTKYGKKVEPKQKKKPRKLKPCICGSVICKKDWQKLKKEERSIKTLKIKRCVCGSDICREESQKMPEILLQAARKAQHDKERAKQAILDEKQYQKERLHRKHMYAIEDHELHKKRQHEDKREMKLVKKYDTAPSVLMVAESLIDLGSFGAKAFCDVMKSAGRVVKHPRDGVYNVKDAVQDPSRAAKEIKRSLRAMGLHSTLARIKRRMLKMPVTKSAITKLESVPVTNYLVHMADKDPKQRMKKFKKKRFREPLDFQCSLYMASLRKRPLLKFYFMCPWFYPHLISLLRMWRQFTDILVFLLAVVVWSPCILCMECCRYLTCFIFCSGG